MEVQRKTTTTATRKRTKRPTAPKRARTVSPVSICSTDSELSSLAGSDSDGALDCLLDMNMESIYPVAALRTLDVCEGQAGRLEKGGDDLHSWIDILLSDE